MFGFDAYLLVLDTPLIFPVLSKHSFHRCKLGSVASPKGFYVLLTRIPY